MPAWLSLASCTGVAQPTADTIVVDVRVTAPERSGTYHGKLTLVGGISSTEINTWELGFMLLVNAGKFVPARAEYAMQLPQNDCAGTCTGNDGRCGHRQPGFSSLHYADQAAGCGTSGDCRWETSVENHPTFCSLGGTAGSGRRLQGAAGARWFGGNAGTTFALSFTAFDNYKNEIKQAVFGHVFYAQLLLAGVEVRTYSSVFDFATQAYQVQAVELPQVGHYTVVVGVCVNAAGNAADCGGPEVSEVTVGAETVDAREIPCDAGTQESNAEGTACLCLPGTEKYSGSTEVWARSHCRFVPPRIHFIPDSLAYLVPLFLKRQCDRTLGHLRQVRRRPRQPDGRGLPRLRNRPVRRPRPGRPMRPVPDGAPILEQFRAV